jgi:paraquat-inducible protein B
MDSVKELERTLKEVRQVAVGVDRDVMPKVAAALDQVRGTLKSADGLVAPESPTAVELRRMMQELSAAARAVRSVADYLDRHPEALIQGKGGMR